MWYIYNADAIIMATCSGKPDDDDLASRGEAAFFHPEPLGLGWKVVFDQDGKPVGAEPVEEG